ncbi:MAG: DegT/DnrJ/EryC1/StrS family aminotransferase [Candidatus Diapherotrites archaeon]|nr:DegT/DnrJ/EryC1/StrS family aminotransferase [Candidatus Diapherotrites archaeon]
MAKISFVDLKRQYESIKPEIDAAISEAVQRADYILGADVELFEKEYANFCGAKNCVSVDSGTSALHLALKASGVKRGDEVITTPNTFIATALAISFSGAKPVFVDCDSESYNLDVSKLEVAITKKTKAIIPVHLYGQPAEMKQIKEIADKHDIKIIEDCCQAHGAEYRQKKLPVTDVGCFSFYPGKNLGAYGDGGAVVTSDNEFAERIRELRNYGSKIKYYHSCIGFNNRLDNLQAAVLRVKLNHLEKWNNARRKNARIYNELLEPYGVITPKELPNRKHIYHLYIIRTNLRQQLMAALTNAGIAFGIHYPVPIHLQEAYNELRLKKGMFPITEKISGEVLSLPMFSELKCEEIQEICRVVGNSVS